MKDLLVALCIFIIVSLMLIAFGRDSSNIERKKRHLVSTTRTVVQSKIKPKVKRFFSKDEDFAASVYCIDGKLYQFDIDLEAKDSVIILWYKYDKDTTAFYELVKV